jgi:hypothetical protein
MPTTTMTGKPSHPGLSNDVPKATQFLDETSSDEHVAGEETVSHSPPPATVVTATGWRTRVFPLALIVVSVLVVVVFGLVLLKSKT